MIIEKTYVPRCAMPHKKTERQLSQSKCPIERAAALVGDPWVLLILRELREHARRFNELRAAIANISPRTLSARLKFLEQEGIIVRTVIPETPPRVEYSLTEKGRALMPIITQLQEYGETWLAT